MNKSLRLLGITYPYEKTTRQHHEFGVTGIAFQCQRWTHTMCAISDPTPYAITQNADWVFRHYPCIFHVINEAIRLNALL